VASDIVLEEAYRCIIKRVLYMNLTQSLIVILTITAIGFLCGKKRLFNDIQLEGFEIFLFKVAIPAYLFSSILSHNFSSLVNVQYIYCYSLSFVSVALVTGFYFRHRNSTSDICIKILASGYVNAAIYTLPVITFLLGDPKAAILGNLIQVILIQSVFLIILSFIKHKEKTVWQKLVTTFLNPIVILPIFGILLCYFQLKPPLVVSAVAQNLGNGASSLSLFLLGLNLSHVKINREQLNKDLLFVILAKNVLHPVAAILCASYIFHLEGYWFNAMVIASSAPTAFVVYLLAKQFSVDAHFVKITVAISSIVSLMLLGLMAQIMVY
jgi:predicted permease